MRNAERRMKTTVEARDFEMSRGLPRVLPSQFRIQHSAFPHEKLLKSMIGVSVGRTVATAQALEESPGFIGCGDG